MSVCLLWLLFCILVEVCNSLLPRLLRVHAHYNQFCVIIGVVVNAKSSASAETSGSVPAGHSPRTVWCEAPETEFLVIPGTAGGRRRSCWTAWLGREGPEEWRGWGSRCWHRWFESGWVSNRRCCIYGGRWRRPWTSGNFDWGQGPTYFSVRLQHQIKL